MGMKQGTSPRNIQEVKWTRLGDRFSRHQVDKPLGLSASYSGHRVGLVCPYLSWSACLSFSRGVRTADGGSYLLLRHRKLFPVAVILVLASRWEPKIGREGGQVSHAHPVLRKGFVLHGFVTFLGLASGPGFPSLLVTASQQRHLTSVENCRCPKML